MELPGGTADVQLGGGGVGTGRDNAADLFSCFSGGAVPGFCDCLDGPYGPRISLGPSFVFADLF